MPSPSTVPAPGTGLRAWHASDRVPAAEHFARSLPALGGEEIRVAVGDVVVAFEGLSAELAAELSGRFGPFVTSDPPVHRARVTLGDARYLDPTGDLHLRLEEIDVPGDRILASYDFAARWEGAAGIVRLARERLEGAAGAVENYLRWVAADLVLDRGAFVLHSSGLARDGRAYVFFGPSGAGKSTVASLSPGTLLLSDDLVLLVRRGGSYLASTTPFSGSLAQLAKARETFPVAGLFRLRQASETRLAPASVGRATGMLLASCPFVSRPERRLSTLLPLVEGLARAVGVDDLYFRKDNSFWDAIMRRPGAVSGAAI